MILRNKDGIFKVEIHDHSMFHFFTHDVGHWGKNPFKNDATAYIIDVSATVSFGPVKILIFPGDVFGES